MTKRIPAAALLLLFAAASFGQAKPAQSGAAPAPPPLKLKVGDTVPDFSLKYSDGSGPLKEFKLSDYRGKKNVLLAFFIFAFTSG